MKAFFKKAGVDCADYCLPKNFADGKAFTDEHGFPVVVKPDDGVGACDTYTLRTESEMADFSRRNRTCLISWKPLSTVMSKRLTA